MEQFFVPSRRPRIEPHGYTEVMLAVSVEAFLNHRWEWSDFRAFATGTGGEMRKIIMIIDVAGIIEDTFIWVEDGNTRMELDELNHNAIQCATFTTPSGDTYALFLARAGSPALEPALVSAGAYSVFWRAVTTSNCVKLSLENTRDESDPYAIPETTLLPFLEASPSLRLLEFEHFDFKEADCHALATLERTSVEVTFKNCSFDARGGEDTFGTAKS
jgi:hypothetical protein